MRQMIFILAVLFFNIDVNAAPITPAEIEMLHSFHTKLEILDDAIDIAGSTGNGTSLPPELKVIFDRMKATCEYREEEYNHANGGGTKYRFLDGPGCGMPLEKTHYTRNSGAVTASEYATESAILDPVTQGIVGINHLKTSLKTRLHYSDECNFVLTGTDDETYTLTDGKIVTVLGSDSITGQSCLDENGTSIFKLDSITFLHDLKYGAVTYKLSAQVTTNSESCAVNNKPIDCKVFRHILGDDETLSLKIRRYASLVRKRN